MSVSTRVMGVYAVIACDMDWELFIGSCLGVGGRIGGWRCWNGRVKPKVCWAGNCQGGCGEGKEEERQADDNQWAEKETGGQAVGNAAGEERETPIQAGGKARQPWWWKMEEKEI